VLSKSDQEIAAVALADLSTVLDIRGTPELTRVYRWSRSSPQLEVGHSRIMTRIDESLKRHRGLFVSAAGFRGVGIPDCIADARAAGAAAAEFARAGSTASPLQ
jgi:oxygen-dependent protoporphyrinogen oxidase